MGQDFKINAMGKSQLMNNPLLFFNLYNNIKIWFSKDFGVFSQDIKQKRVAHTKCPPS